MISGITPPEKISCVMLCTRRGALGSRHQRLFQTETLQEAGLLKVMSTAAQKTSVRLPRSPQDVPGNQHNTPL
jgi:hypothetical protein